MSAIVLVGFARSFYLKGTLGPARKLSPLAIAHGVLMTAWFALFLVQAILVLRRRLDLHRVWGVVGGVLSLAVAATSTAATLVATTEVRAVRGTLAVAGSFIGVLVLFLLLVGAGLVWRKDAESHKRLMTLASLSILGAAIARFPIKFFADHGQVLVDGLIAWFVVGEMVRTRAWHWVSFVAAALTIAAQHALVLL